jgi:uncharacterized protein YjbI with pentapeptide repeats
MCLATRHRPCPPTHALTQRPRPQFPKSHRQDANLSDVLMDRATMVETNLKNAILQRAVFTRSDLKDAVIEGADFTNALLDKTQVMVSAEAGARDHKGENK